MKRFRIGIYSADPRVGIRPSGELVLQAASPEAATALAVETLADFPWRQLDASEASCHEEQI